MSIEYNLKEKIFHLKTETMSYVINILETGHLAHLYWGKPIRKVDNLSRLICRGDAPLEPVLAGTETKISLDLISQEYPAYGNTDFRKPAYQVKDEEGYRISSLLYDHHEIIPGKESLAGLPATYVEKEDEAETLKIYLKDPQLGLKAVLFYTIFKEFNALTRSVLFINEGKEDLKLLRALSASVDFTHADFELLQLSGAWARERYLKRRPLMEGIQSVDSTRGASSPYHNPFVALVDPDTTEDRGEVYGFNLVYSGNFLAEVEVNHYQKTRLLMGINPFDFSWLLKSGESFQTPEVVMVYSDQGLNKMSQIYHRLYRKRLARGEYRDKPRPILINNWEATYFDFNTEKILELAREAKDLGIELFVLDDGWFGKRNDDTSSLGDWYVNREKLPGGLAYLGKEINKLGLKFGLWFEPEMVSPDSDLYRQHPDWALHVPGRESSLGRNQLILDFSRDDVCQYIIDSISNILEEAPIEYVKWDMNRNMTEIGSALLPPERQQETAHRYILGLYKVLEEITGRCPHVLFESCASGGGRFDPGMLYYMPQTWTSDNTDAVERLKIQYGTSLVYPLVSMGAHVSAVPNHQVGRITPLKMRGEVAFFGNFGYELDLTQLSTEEKEIVKRQVKEYKELRQLIQQGDFYRLKDPFSGNVTAWQVVAPDKERSFFGFYRVLARANQAEGLIRLKGLNPRFDYRLKGYDGIYGGDELMNIGIKPLRKTGDFQSMTILIERV